MLKHNLRHCRRWDAVKIFRREEVGCRLPRRRHVSIEIQVLGIFQYPQHRTVEARPVDRDRLHIVAVGPRVLATRANALGTAMLPITCVASLIRKRSLTTPYSRATATNLRNISRKPLLPIRPRKMRTASSHPP